MELFLCGRVISCWHHACVHDPGIGQPSDVYKLCEHVAVAQMVARSFSDWKVSGSFPGFETSSTQIAPVVRLNDQRSTSRRWNPVR